MDGATPPGPSKGHIKATLTRRLGVSPCLGRAAEGIYRLIASPSRAGGLPIKGDWSVTPHPATDAYLNALETIVSVAPDMIGEAHQTLAYLHGRGAADHREVQDFARSIDDLQQLLRLARRMHRPKFSAIVPKPDPRARWHPTARAFAGLIESDFKSAKVEPPTRDSKESPLVVAVVDLLAMIGEERQPDAVRKALVGKSRRP